VSACAALACRRQHASVTLSPRTTTLSLRRVTLLEVMGDHAGLGRRRPGEIVRPSWPSPSLDLWSQAWLEAYCTSPRPPRDGAPSAASRCPAPPPRSTTARRGS